MGHINEKFNHLGPLLLLGRLGTGYLSLSNDKSSSYLDHTPSSPGQSLLMADMCDLGNFSLRAQGL